MSNLKYEVSSLKIKTFSGLMWSFLDLIFNQGINFLVQIILARLLFPRDFGTIAIISVLIGIVSIFIDSGLSNALIREKDVSQEDYSTVFYFNLLASIAMYILLFILAPLISSFFNDNKLILMIRVLTIGIILNALELNPRVMLTKKVDFKTQTKVSIVASTVSGVIAVILAFSNYGVWSLIIRVLSMYSIQTTILWGVNKWKPDLTFSINSFKRLFKFGWKMLASNLLDKIYNNIFYLVIGKCFSQITLGYYTNAVKLSEPTYTIITQAVDKVSFSVLSNITDNMKLREAYRIIIKNTTFVIIPVLLGLCIIAQPLIMVILGGKWVQSIEYFQILCISGIFFPIGIINLNILQIKGRSDLFLWIEIIKKSILIITIVTVLICRLGIMGLLWGIFINSVIGYFINSYFSKSLIQYSTFQQIYDIKATIITGIIMGAFVYGIGIIFPMNNLFRIMIQATVGITVYFTANKVINSEELKTITELINLLLKSKFIKK